ncbi:MAG: phosphatidylinositol-specific phospholipase C/glycerophosphodiester phosphodiesterase family protein [Polyangiales bacterium]
MQTSLSRTMACCAVAFTIASAALAQADDRRPQPTAALARAHAHNDYEHDRPLFDALAQGFTSVEADVWLVDGELLVAHDLTDVSFDRTLESLYLQPLRELARAHGGRIYRDFPHSIQLLIDIKSDAEPTYAALHRVLARYASIITVFSPRGVHERAVTAVISGNRPRETMEAQSRRYAGYDGRRADLGSDALAEFIPLISDNWETIFTWRGVGEFPEAERELLHDIVETAHTNGQRVRLWATPEDPATREAVWQVLLEAGVDYLNTDDLAGLAAYLHEHDQHVSVPNVDWFEP